MLTIIYKEMKGGWLTFFLNLCYLGAKFNDPSWGGQRGTPYGSKVKNSGREKRSLKNNINGGHFPCMAVLLQFIRAAGINVAYAD